MKIFLAGEFWNGALGASYSREFKKIGHDVTEFDFNGQIENISSFARNRYLRRLIWPYLSRNINRRLIEAVKNTKPELIFVFKGSPVFPDTLKEIKEFGKALLFNFNPDNPFNLNPGASNDYIRAAIPLYDCYFIWGKFLILNLKQAGARNVEYLPFASDSYLHFPLGVSDEEKKIYGNNIAFIGTWEQEREEWLEHLKDYDLAIWGSLWERLRRNSPLRSKWKGKTALGEDFAKVCNASKIVLNLIRRQNGDAHNMRTFEVPACRGFMLTMRTKEQSEFFNEGSEISCFETADELKKRIDYYLSNENLRAKCALAAYQKAKDHTYDNRAKQILEVYSKMRSVK